MSGMFVRRMAVIATALALAGCGTVETASRDRQILNPERLTLRSAVSTQFQNEVDTVVHFAFDKDTLDPRARRIVAAQAAWINAHPNVKFAVTGHTDRVGSSAYNMDLGMRRASRVVAALTALGVDPSRLIARISDGEDRNIINTENRERLNRRTVTEVIAVTASGRVAAGNAAAGAAPGRSTTATSTTVSTGSTGDGTVTDPGTGTDRGGDPGTNTGSGTAGGSHGIGNPGNDRSVGRAGERPNDRSSWGSGVRGKAD